MPISLEKSTSRTPGHEKWRKQILSELFAQILKVSRFKYKIKKTFHWQKIINFFLCTRILHLWDQCQIFLFQIARKVCSGSEKIDKFFEEKTIRTFFCTIWMHFQKHCRNVFGRQPKLLLSQSKKNVVFWGKNQKSSAN